MVVKGFRWELGDGSRVGFWREIWVGDKSLRDLCPRLYELAVHKEGMVSEMGEWEGDRWRWNMEWKRERLGRVRDEEEVFWEMLGPVQLKKGKEDCWRWVHGLEGRYVVKKAYEVLAPMQCLLTYQFCKMSWCRLVPSNVSFFGWRLCLDKFPTKVNLRKRGVGLQGEDLMCGLCNGVLEEANHVFCTCKIA
ncbi:hypothetical protein SLA2020_115770 [Shorea laevis]